MPRTRNTKVLFLFKPVLLSIFLFSIMLTAQDVYTPADLFNTKEASSAKISPDGKTIAYLVRSQRQPDQKPGGSWYELYIVDVKTGESKPYIVGKESVRSIAWKPDGSAISFIDRRYDQKKNQIWMIPVSGGEARSLTHSPTSVLSYAWHPETDQLAYVAETPPTAREKALKENGFDFVYFEENLKDRNLYMFDLKTSESRQLTHDVSIWSFTFSPDGRQIAAAVTDKNLIDHSYMFQKIHLIDISSAAMRQLSDNPGKLGNFCFSPDGAYLAYAAALEQKDHSESQVFVIPVNGGKTLNLTPSNFRGHVEWVGWKDAGTVVYQAGEGVHNTLNTVPRTGGERNIILSSEQNGGVIFESVDFTDDFKHFAFLAESKTYPREVFYWQPGKKMQRMTNLNSWLDQKKLGRQKVIRYTTRDGLEIEGLLIYPVDYKDGQRYPLVVIVHGGPESHYSDGWLTGYSTPGQILAGKGYFTFYPNYGSSTGYGVEFAARGYNDAAGKEFDDIADGIDHLIDRGLVDGGRVGLGGGSYGGFASAWFATYYTEKVKAVCMFVGISDLVSKRGTTDIPYEELYVHSGKKLEDMWQKSLERSPIYHAHKSRTATLIYGGTDDPRVHPSQSIELYRRMKMNDHPAVRLVQYPGEHHGNSKQPGRIDVLYRILDWYDWYVAADKPIKGPMPPLDISEKYGLELPAKNDK